MFPDSCYFLRISSGVGLFFEQFLICRLRPSCLQDIHVTFSSKWFFLNRQHFMWHCSRHPVQLMLYLLNITFLSSRLHCQQLTHEVVVVQHSMLQLTVRVRAWPVGADLLQSLSWQCWPWWRLFQMTSGVVCSVFPVELLNVRFWLWSFVPSSIPTPIWLILVFFYLVLRPA